MPRPLDRPGRPRRAARARIVAAIGLTLGVTPACGPASPPAAPCDRLVASLARCATTPLPAGALDSVERFCRLSLRYQPAPDDRPDNLAALTRDALLACAAVEPCQDLHACLDRHGCQLVAAGPGQALQFTCWPPAPPAAPRPPPSP